MKSSKTALLRLFPLLGLVILLLSVSPAVFAQTKISGTLTNKQSAPIAGASIHVVKAARYTTSNNAGQFSIEAAIGDVIEITCIGYSKKQVTVSSNDLKIQLEESSGQLDNVIVIGYGLQKKKLVTGANVHVKGDDIQKQSTTDPLLALQ